MQAVDLILSPTWIVPIVPEGLVLDNHSVVIADEKIIDVLPTDDIASKYTAKEVKILDQQVIMPGLVNLHTHSPMVLFRGLADDLQLMDWLNNHIWPAENDVINAQSNSDGMRLAIAEMLRGGTTCFNEMYFFPNESAQVAIEEGMRGCLGHTIMNVPTGWAQNQDEYIAKARSAHSDRPQNDLITWSVSPQSTYTNDDNSLMAARELAAELDIMMNIHLHESPGELALHQSQHGMRPIERLNKLDYLYDRLVAVHMTQLTDAEIALVKEKGLHIAHCPESNLKLASGVAPINRLLNEGINVGVGTDGAASNNDLDMFGELRTASFAAKGFHQDPLALPAARILTMGTLNGAKAMGLDHKIGSVEIGKQADLIAIDMSHYFTQPIYNPISHLAFAVNRLQVSHVWINGQCLLAGGDFTKLDIEKTLAQTKQWTEMAAKYASNASNVPA